MTKIGDALYLLDRYHRKSDPKWIPYEVIGETKLSWLVKKTTWGEPEKVNKKTMLAKSDFRGMRDRYFTADQRDAEDFYDRNISTLKASVERCRDIDKLRQIAAITGVDML